MTENTIKIDIIMDYTVKEKGSKAEFRKSRKKKLSTRRERPEPEYVSRKGQGRNQEAKRYLSETPKRRATPETGQAPFSIPYEDPTPIGLGKLKSKKKDVTGRGYHIVNRIDGNRVRVGAESTFGINPESIKEINKRQDKKLAELEKALLKQERADASAQRQVKDKTFEGISGTQDILSTAGTGTIAAPKQLVGRLAGLINIGGPIGIAITAIITAPEIITQLIKLMSAKGMPFNKDWSRHIEDEVNGLFSLEEKKRRLLGIDQYIYTQTDRYQPNSGAPVANSFENQEEINTAKNSSVTAFGVTYGN